MSTAFPIIHRRPKVGASLRISLNLPRLLPISFGNAYFLTNQEIACCVGVRHTVTNQRIITTTFPLDRDTTYYINVEQQQGERNINIVNAKKSESAQENFFNSLQLLVDIML